MNHHTTTIPRILFERPATPLDHYLRHILETERTERWLRWHIYMQICPTDSAELVEQLQRQAPTPHMDAVEERVN